MRCDLSRLNCQSQSLAQGYLGMMFSRRINYLCARGTRLRSTLTWGPPQCSHWILFEMYRVVVSSVVEHHQRCSQSTIGSLTVLSLWSNAFWTISWSRENRHSGSSRSRFEFGVSVGRSPTKVSIFKNNNDLVLGSPESTSFAAKEYLVESFDVYSSCPTQSLRPAFCVTT